VDYDLWCGPADKVDLYRPKLHYDWHWDYNTGAGDMGNQGIHQMDIARWFLGEAKIAPRTISIGGRVGYDDAGNTANTQIVYHDYESAPLIFETRGLPKSKKAQKNWGGSMDNYRGSQIGVIVQCENGYVVIPSYTQATAFDNDGKKLQSWNGGGDHYANFLKAVKSRKRSDLNADILEGHISSALCHTGNISHMVGGPATADEIASTVRSSDLLAESFDRMANHLRANEVDIDSSTLTLGPWVEFDVDKEVATNNNNANQYVKREGRKPFVVPTVG
ncbi:MAG: gfo/Idh/MocA family oxidoreductase, partial [Pirellulales bacterium]